MKKTTEPCTQLLIYTVGIGCMKFMNNQFLAAFLQYCNYVVCMEVKCMWKKGTDAAIFNTAIITYSNFVANVYDVVMIRTLLQMSLKAG